MSDPGINFSKSIGWTKGSARTARYAVIIDHGKVVYAENEPAGDVTVRRSKNDAFYSTTNHENTRFPVLRRCLQGYEGSRRGLMPMPLKFRGDASIFTQELPYKIYFQDWFILYH